MRISVRAHARTLATDTVSPAEESVAPQTYTPRGAAAAAAWSIWDLPRPGSPTCGDDRQTQNGRGRSLARLLHRVALCISSVSTQQPRA